METKRVLLFDGGVGTLVVEAEREATVEQMTTGLVQAVKSGAARFIGLDSDAQEATATRVAAAYGGNGVAVRLTRPGGAGQLATLEDVPSEGSLIAFGRENIGGGS